MSVRRPPTLLDGTLELAVPAEDGTILTSHAMHDGTLLLSYVDDAGWLIELARYVRTPAGVRRYKRPIGALIGGSGTGLPKGQRRGADYVRAALKARGKRNARNAPSATVKPAAPSLNQLYMMSARERTAALASTPRPQLAALDAELTRRVALLGKAGQVSKTHKSVKQAMARAA